MMTTYLLKHDGSGLASGCDAHGEVGLGSTNHKYKFGQIAKSGGAAVIGGRHHTAVLKKDGSLHLAGYNNHGELGDGTRPNRNTFIK